MDKRIKYIIIATLLVMIFIVICGLLICNKINEIGNKPYELFNLDEEFIKDNEIIKNEIGEIKEIKREGAINLNPESTSSYIVSNTEGNIFEISIYRNYNESKEIYYFTINDKKYYNNTTK